MDSPLARLLLRLDAARRGFFWLAVAIGAGTAVCWAVSGQLYALLARPLTRELGARGLDTRLAFVHLTDPFVVYFTVSLLGGLVLTSPLAAALAWKVLSAGGAGGWRPVAFGLAGATLFVGGVAFGYGILLPFAIGYLLDVAGRFEQVITVREYLTFAARLLMALGLAAELPLLTLALARLGIVRAGTLWRGFPYAALVAFTLAALITPPDGISQVLVAVPLLLLYLAGIGVAWLAAPPERRDSDDD